MAHENETRCPGCSNTYFTDDLNKCFYCSGRRCDPCQDAHEQKCKAAPELEPLDIFQEAKRISLAQWQALHGV